MIGSRCLRVTRISNCVAKNFLLQNGKNNLNKQVIRQSHGGEYVTGCWRRSDILTSTSLTDMDLSKLLDIGGIFLASSADCEHGYSLKNLIKTIQRKRLQENHMDMLIRIKSYMNDKGNVNLSKVYQEWLKPKGRTEKYFYRKCPPPFSKKELFKYECLGGIIWYWILWNFFTNYKELGAPVFPEPSEWTDEELGIPPEED